MAPPRVIPIHQSPLNTCKSFLLVGERVVVVDAGPPGGHRAVERTLRAEGLAPNRVSLLLVTHGHTDHVGGVAATQRITGAPIATDVRERDYVEGRARAPLEPTGLAARLFLHTPLPHEPFEPVSPEIWIDEPLDLRRYGVDARVLRSGGHTAGSLSVHVPGTGELIAGDLLSGGIGIGGILFHGRVIAPPFHDDVGRVHQAVAELLALDGLRTIHVCHGGPLRPQNVAHWLLRATRGVSGAQQ